MINTENTWLAPCLTGCDISAAAAILAALPIPDSCDSKPFFTPSIITAPAIPVLVALKLNAPTKISDITLGNLPTFIIITAIPMPKYPKAITGTMYDETKPILLMPPNITTSVIIAKIIPIMSGPYCLALSGIYSITDSVIICD